MNLRVRRTCTTKYCGIQVTDLSLPVALCEPVTDMQRRGDFLEYVELLHDVRPLPSSSSFQRANVEDMT